MKSIIIILSLLIFNILKINCFEKNDLIELSNRLIGISNVFWNKTVNCLFPEYVTCRYGFENSERDCKIYFDKIIPNTSLAPIQIIRGKKSIQDGLKEYGKQLVFYEKNIEKMLNISSDGFLYICNRKRNESICKYYCPKYIRFYKEYLCFIENNLLPSLKRAIKDYVNLLNYQPKIEMPYIPRMEINKFSSNIDLFFANFVIARSLKLQVKQLINFAL